MEVQGKVKMIGETQTFGNNGFRKREIVVTTEELQQMLVVVNHFLLCLLQILLNLLQT